MLPERRKQRSVQTGSVTPASTASTVESTWKVVSAARSPELGAAGGGSTVGRETGGARTAEGDVQYLVMEYLEGQTLEDRLRQGALAVDDVLRIGSEIAEAVDAAHRKGVVHHDLIGFNLTWLVIWAASVPGHGAVRQSRRSRRS